MHTYTVEILDWETGEILRETRIVANSATEARRFALARNVFSGEGIGHVYRED